MSLVILAACPWLAAQETQLPDFGAVSRLVESHFARLPDFRAGDLISRREVTPLFSDLQRQGWEVADKQEILDKMLDGGDALVQTVRTPQGHKFMRKVSSYRLIYDRLDRIAREPGGRRLLADLVKLPDAERYAKMTPRRGVPGMLEFLPKTGSGKSRRIKDYEKPTGRIYTAEAFLKRLRESHASALAKAAPSK